MATVTGLREIEKAMEGLTKAAGRGVLRRALFKVSEPLVEAMKTGAARDDGDLMKSITASTKLDRRQAARHKRQARATGDKFAAEIFVGPSYDLGAGGRHGHLVEFGTAPHVNGGQFAGTMHPGTKAQPFMRPAWDGGKDKLMNDLKAELWAEIDKAAARAARKAARAG